MSDVEEMLKLARSQGFIDYVDFKKYLPNEITDQEQIQDIVDLLKGMGVEVRFKSAEVLNINLAGCREDTMFEIDVDIWRIYDPDGVLKLSFDATSSSLVDFLKGIHPREDLVQLVNSNIIVDLGYYGSEIELDGKWVARVVDTNIEDPWDHPIECESFAYSEFVPALKRIEMMVAKYT